MNKITNITRNEIFKLLFNGCTDYDIFGDPIPCKINYFGELDEVDFLSKLFDLKNLPSSDNRVDNAEEDIIRHTRLNDDYPINFIATDDRFLQDATDELFLNFLCKVFHPEIRCENGYWRIILNNINNALVIDGFELYPVSQISGRDVYGWRIYRPKEPYLPYSLRHKQEIESKTIKFSISKPLREQIYRQIIAYNSEIYATSETGYNYSYYTVDKLLNEISKFYQPKCYISKDQYADTQNLEQFIMYTRPYCVFDAIEIYSSMIGKNDFEAIINRIFEVERFTYIIENGKINSTTITSLKADLTKSVEVGVKELLQKASEYYNKGNKEVAVEKLWDAYERLKTLIDSNKQKSAESLISKISNGVTEYQNLFKAEFKALNEIGNNFRIRHHEINKTDIDKNYYYEYFFHRCLALINLSLNFINE